MNGSEGCLFSSHEQIGGINLISLEGGDSDSADWVYLRYAINLVSPKCDAQQVVRICQINIHSISFDAEITTIKVDIVADIQTVYQAAEENIAVNHASPFYFNHIFIKVRRVSHTIDTGNGRDHYYVFSSGE